MAVMHLMRADVPRRRALRTPRAIGALGGGRPAFTLIEILGVVVILGIISAIILPQLGTRDDQKAISGARVVVADVMYAQNRAIATQKIHYVAFDTVANTYTVLDAWPAGIIKHPVNGTPYVVKFGPAGGSQMTSVKIFTANFDANAVLAFDAMGVPHSYDPATAIMTALNAGSVVVQSGSFKMTVSIAPFSGEVSMN
jgi:prepilin-type N-terminal cleavage/methylation domain-containing protein